MDVTSLLKEGILVGAFSYMNIASQRSHNGKEQSILHLLNKLQFFSPFAQDNNEFSMNEINSLI